MRYYIASTVATIRGDFAAFCSLELLAFYSLSNAS